MHRSKSASDSNNKTTSFQKHDKMNGIQKADITVKHGTLEHREHIGFDTNGKFKVNFWIYIKEDFLKTIFI
jgi:hypothetical protein